MAKKTETLELLIEKIESNIRLLETETVSLDKSLSVYERTISTSKKALALLTKCETKFNTLKKDSDDLLQQLH